MAGECSRCNHVLECPVCAPHPARRHSPPRLDALPPAPSLRRKAEPRAKASHSRSRSPPVFSRSASFGGQSRQCTRVSLSSESSVSEVSEVGRVCKRVSEPLRPEKYPNLATSKASGLKPSGHADALQTHAPVADALQADALQAVAVAGAAVAGVRFHADGRRRPFMCRACQKDFIDEWNCWTRINCKETCQATPKVRAMIQGWNTEKDWEYPNMSMQEPAVLPPLWQ